MYVTQVCMHTILLPAGVNPIAVNRYISYHIIVQRVQSSCLVIFHNFDDI